MEHFKQLKAELGNLRTDFDMFKQKDFGSLEDRETALEKKLTALST